MRHSYLRLNKHRQAKILSQILRALGKWGKLYANARARFQGVAIGVLLERGIAIQRLENLGEHLHHIALASIFKSGMEGVVGDDMEGNHRPGGIGDGRRRRGRPMKKHGQDGRATVMEEIVLENA
jgi:hypothetical protein